MKIYSSLIETNNIIKKIYQSKISPLHKEKYHCITVFRYIRVSYCKYIQLILILLIAHVVFGDIMKNVFMSGV